MSQTKFTGAIGGKEYKLFQLVIPHHDEFQATIGEVVRDYISEHSHPKSVTALDLGAGTGITTKVLLAADSRIHVIAIDNDERMINELQNTFKERFIAVQADVVEALKQLPANSIDVVASGYCIHNMSKEWRTAVFQEIYRVLHPGGLVVNGDKIAVDDEAEHQAMLSWQFEQFHKFNEVGHPDLFKEWTAHYHEDESIRFTETEQREILGQAGFIDINQVYRERMETIFIATKL